ncbi:unnamed protein product [Lactuca saligna]|uniref:Uncharacterized protein n=1 Tax=Lactuca saligna TaxID=75948 RepID=A0AA35ZDE0_LACSI|nr:unnamed protein product [Lactuca saligna]
MCALPLSEQLAFAPLNFYSSEIRIHKFSFGNLPDQQRFPRFGSFREKNLEIQVFIDSLKNTPSEEVPTSDNIVDDPPQNEVAATRDILDSTNALDDPRTFTSAEVPDLDVEDDSSDEIIFDDHNTFVGVIQQFEEEEEKFKGNRHASPPPEATLEGDQGEKTQDDLIDDSKPTKPIDAEYENNKTLESSTSDT